MDDVLLTPSPFALCDVSHITRLERVVLHPPPFFDFIYDYGSPHLLLEKVGIPCDIR